MRARCIALRAASNSMEAISKQCKLDLSPWENAANSGLALEFRPSGSATEYSTGRQPENGASSR
jgi:hypothetical protein